jgi:DNA-binding Lrp family transcriptional regulator
MSTVELAGKLDSSTTMVSNRIKKLVNREIIQGFRVHFDYQKLGYQLFNVRIGLKNYDKINQIINYIKFNPNLTSIYEVINHCDLSFTFLLKSFHELHPIINDIFNQFPNDVKNHTTFTFPKIFKSNYLPGDLTNSNNL